MSQGVVGTCSLCGGDVVGHIGAWFAVVPPPLARCSRCGAVEARGKVIEMIRDNRPTTFTTTNNTIITKGEK